MFSLLTSGLIATDKIGTKNLLEINNLLHSRIEAWEWSRLILQTISQPLCLSSGVWNMFSGFLIWPDITEQKYLYPDCIWYDKHVYPRRSQKSEIPTAALVFKALKVSLGKPSFKKKKKSVKFFTLGSDPPIQKKEKKGFWNAILSHFRPCF